MPNPIKTILGIHICGTKSTIGLISRKGEIIAEANFMTGANNSYHFFIHQIRIRTQKLIEETSTLIKLVGVGIAAPYVNIETQMMENPPNFKWGKSIPLASSIKKLFNVPTFLINDANAAGLGEKEFGKARKMKNFVVITLGSCLGSGIISDGHILNGAHGQTGEIGHINVDPNGRQCSCGNRGCLETYVSANGVKRTVFNLMCEMTEKSPLRKISFKKMRLDDIVMAAQKKDPLAIRAFEITGKILGNKLAEMVAFLEPEAIILSGKLPKMGEVFLEATTKSLKKNLFVSYQGKVKVFLSDQESNLGLLGAAAYAWRNLKETDKPSQIVSKRKLKIG